MPPSLLLGALGGAAVRPLTLGAFRSLPLATRTLHVLATRRSPALVTLHQRQSRNFSLTNIFGAKPQSALQPETVAEVARKEEFANAHPHDVHAQLALFQAYADLDRKEGWELVLARWERMTEFVGLPVLLQYRCLY